MRLSTTALLRRWYQYVSAALDACSALFKALPLYLVGLSHSIATCLVVPCNENPPLTGSVRLLSTHPALVACVNISSLHV